MQDLREIIGKNIRAVRILRGFTQEWLAAEAGIDRSFLSQVEQGGQNVSVDTLSAIIKVLNISMDVLVSPQESLLWKLDTSTAELTGLIGENPSLRGFVTGYLAEIKLRKFVETLPGVTETRKFDDHDRTNKHDLEVCWGGESIPLRQNHFRRRQLSDVQMEQ